MQQNRASNVVTTRILSDGDLDNLMNSIGTYLISQRFTPKVHSRKSLEYRAEVAAKRGFLAGLFSSSKADDVVVQVTDLPIGFSVDNGPQISITVGLAFGISAPAPLFNTLSSMLAPYAANIEQLESNAGQFLVGRTFNKKVPGVACEHCGYKQEITIPISISRIEGARGYGPGGSATLICSNSACNMSFPVDWDNVVVEIDMRSQITQQHRTQTRPNRVPPARPSPTPPKSRIPPRKATAVWIPQGETARIQGFDIPGGLIYVGSNLPDAGGYSNDACLIDPTLKVFPPGVRGVDDSLGYWPRYDSISPLGRGKYLEWLAGGRRDPRADMGYVFLFFYGLERRLLIDGSEGKVSADERTQMVDEVLRLREIYGDSVSFQSYSGNFLTMEWMLYHSNDPPPDYLIEGAGIGVEPYKVLLSYYTAHEEPLPASVALRWLSLRTDYYKLKTPARRCKDEFGELFAIRYKEKFEDGLMVKPGKKRLRVNYYTASPSVRLSQNRSVTNLPDPFMLTGPVNKLIKVAEECCVELNAYSRLMGQPETERSPFVLAARLPAPLSHKLPEMERLKDYLEEACKDTPAVVSVKDLYEIFRGQPPESFGKKEAEDLAALIEGAGFGIAPHVRYHNMKIAADGSLVVFPGGHGKGFQPSDEFRMMGLVVRLGSLVAQADQDHSQAEEELLQRLIDDSKKLSAVEKQSLLAFLFWCRRTPQTTAGLKKNLAEVNEAGKTAIGRILIAVAYADGRIDPWEVKQLEKLYTNLGLEKERVAPEIHAIAAGAEPVTVSLKDTEASHQIPPPGAVPKKPFVLNPELIQKIIDDTDKAKEILGGIFVRQDELVEADEPAIEQDLANPLATLAAPYRELLQRLLVESTWEQSALEAVCAELGLMPDGAMEVLNEWAFENAETPLIDYGEPVYIDIELARGIMNA